MKEHSKKLFIIAVSAIMILMQSKVLLAQKIYVEPTAKGYHTVVVNALYDRNLYIDNIEASNFTMRCVVTKTPGYGKSGQGYIQILNSRTSEVVLSSDKEKGMRSIFKGMENPYTLIFNTVIKKQFPDLLQRLKALEEPPVVTNNNNKKGGSLKSVEQKLIELKSFYEKGLITKEEYEAQKKKILNGH